MGTTRKLRQRDRLSLTDRVALEVRELATRPFVLAVKDEFAGYFNSLGFIIELTDTALDREIINLRNDILAFMQEQLPNSSCPIAEIKILFIGK